LPSPRIFVGTLACGEAELPESRAAIAAQRGVSVTHLVIENQPELEAHNALWSAWEARKDDHDLFVKVDADTILIRDTALAEIAALFADPDVTGAQILLHDYFTDGLLPGLNAFSKDVTFTRATKRLTPDRVDKGHRTVLKGDPVQHLAPIGWHCRSPHSLQAFHFGLHRALKKQDEYIARCAEVWLRMRDEARGWALAGAMCAGWRTRRHFDYNDEKFRALFEAQNADAGRIQSVEKFARRLAARVA
jgi:hypothetical protein